MKKNKDPCEKEENRNRLKVKGQDDLSKFSYSRVLWCV